MKAALAPHIPAFRRSGVSARIASVVLFLLLGREARADGPAPRAITLVPRHVFVGWGFSIRGGDDFALEPSLLLPLNAKVGTTPIVGVVRPIAGVGGSGVGVGFALQPFFPVENESPQAVAEYLSFLPISLEAHVERMYRPSFWRDATYLGPQLSLSALFWKASAGLMINADDRRDRHAQLGVGCGF